MIDINSSLFIQVALFIFLMIVLNKIFFKPFLRFLEERQEKIQGDEREAARLQEEAERRRLQFEEGLNKGQLQALGEKGTIVDAGAREGKSFVDKAQQEVDEELPRIKAQIDQESRQVAADLERRQGQMAREIAEKLLGRGLQ
ncbi:MAG: ATP synthase F0 subunit B [Deltaproteobacteria bacterium]|nr:ATP synthase F0 subunit B [Deltaproteobacteria bacterium]